MSIVSKYQPYLDELNCSMLTFPVKIADIPKFESSNNLKINVMGVNEKFVVPIYLSKARSDKEINLLYYENHYFLIKNIARLLGKQGLNKAHFCLRCCQGF